MKILLVNPLPAGLMRISTPIGIGYVGASLKAAGYEVKILDQTLKSKQGLPELLTGFEPEVVGITGYSSQYTAMKEAANTSKRFGSTVVVGGIHSSAYPEYVLSDCASIDFVVKGEGEYSFPELLTRSSPVGIPGVYYRNSGRTKSRSPELIEDLDTLPYPWSVLNPSDYCSYKPAGMVTRYSTIASILSSRGCPYGCSFCCASVVLGKKIRLRSASNILDEMELLVKSLGIKEIQIIDDNFSFYPEHVISVCEGIRDRHLKFSWTLTNGIRADRIDEDVLKVMKEAGCYYFAIGIESGSKRILKTISKELSLESVESTTKAASKLGFITQGFFMIGFPGETKKDREMSSDFASKLPLDRMMVAPVMSLPGSDLFNSQFEGRLDEYDWAQSEVKGWKPVPGASDYTIIKKCIRRMRLRFYLNPIRNIRHILKIRTFHQLLGMLLGLKAVVKE